ncbi:porin [Marinobacter xiaoshiensis]|uniref:Porin n=1 Tax=Marinobacter xiaoshiensis TaxID=3073652 RepID=A0ABU2HK16_9GAMM|nr:porin [Marinobacter sp. F60267]MDS1310650.1 porin [Marinobacter sp. F60267]
MKKTLIASAIAAATISGTALAQESNLPTVYGNIQYALTYTNVDGGPSDIAHNDNGSTIGFTHEHAINPGLTGFMKIELDGIDADDKSKGRGRIKLDEAYIGIKGDNFGQLWVGSDDSLYESAVDKIVNYYEVGTYNLGGSYTTGEGDLIQYMTPSFGGLKLGAAVQINGDGEDNGKKSYPYQLAAIYSVDALTLAFAMDSNDGDTKYSQNADLTIKDGGFEAPKNNENTYGVRVAYEMDALGVSLEYQTRKDVSDVVGVQGMYTLGKNVFALSYEMADPDGAAKTAGAVKKDVITLQALHNVSDNLYVYVEGYLGGGDDNAYKVADKSEASSVSVGGTYYF